MSGSVMFSNRSFICIECGGSTPEVKAGPDTTTMSAVDVLGQISKLKATMALKLTQGGVHFVIFCKKKTNVDIESNF